jgi:hypothetical protein
VVRAIGFASAAGANARSIQDCCAERRRRSAAVPTALGILIDRVSGALTGFS